MVDLFGHEMGDEAYEISVTHQRGVAGGVSNHDEVTNPAKLIDIPPPFHRHPPHNGPSEIARLFQDAAHRPSQDLYHGSDPAHPIQQAVAYYPQTMVEELADCEHNYASHNYTGKTAQEIAREVKSWSCELQVPSPSEIALEHCGPPVTIGAEWEILVDPKSSHYGNMDTIPITGLPKPPMRAEDTLNNLPQTQHILKALTDAGFRAATATETKYALMDKAYCSLRFPDVDSRKSRNSRFNEYLIVSVDASVYDDPWKRECDKWKAIEISSQVVTPDRLNEIHEAFSVITKTFKVKVNSSYGLHVHIGNGTRGFSNVWLRSIASLVWASSPIFDIFHPPSRATDHITLSVDGGNQDPANDYLPGQPDHDMGRAIHYHTPRPRHGRPEVAYGPGPQAADPHSQAKATETNNPPPITEHLYREGFCPECAADAHMPWLGVVRLLASPTSRETLYLLRNATSLGGRLNYNFDNLRTQCSELTTQPRTVEFRQHAGTTDVAEICHWAAICAAVVSASRPVLAKDRPELAGIAVANNPKVIDIALKSIRGSFNQTRYDVFDLMLDIGAKDQYDYYLRDHLHVTPQSLNAQQLLQAVWDQDTHRRERNIARRNAAWHQNLGELGNIIQHLARDAAHSIRETVGIALQSISDLTERLNFGQGGQQSNIR